MCLAYPIHKTNPRITANIIDGSMAACRIGSPSCMLEKKLVKVYVGASKSKPYDVAEIGK
jgi:hypothetical protein